MSRPSSWIRPEMKEYARVRMEQTSNNTVVAREIKRKFNLEAEVESIRRTVSKWRSTWKVKAKEGPIKRLFFDIETSYCLGWFWDTGKQYIGPENVFEDKKIICVSYKWQYEDKVHTLTWDKKHDETKMLEKFVGVMGDADELVGHNVDRFDITNLRTRCICNSILMYPTYRTLDTLRKARQYFNFRSNKLDYIAKVLTGGGKKDHEGIGLWHRVRKDEPGALKEMTEYCERDVIILQDVYEYLAPYIWHNNNFAVLKGGGRWECPECASGDVQMHHTYTTPLGIIRRNMRCNACRKQYRVSNKTYMAMLVSLSRNG